MQVGQIFDAGACQHACIASLPKPLRRLQVGARAIWKDKQHPLRHHPSLQLTGIPTLVLWVDGAPVDKLGPELEAASSAEDADGLIESFVSQHHTERSTPLGGAGSQAAVDVHTLMQQLQNTLMNGQR